MKPNAFALYFFSLAAAIPAPQIDPPQIILGKYGYAGTGCPAGEAYVDYSAGKNQITMNFNKFYVQTGPRTSPIDQAKDCTLTINLQYPSGFQFSIVDAEYRGSVKFTTAVSGILNSTYYFTADGHTASVEVW